MRGKALILTAIFLLSISSAFAGWEKKPQLRWSQFYSYDTRRADHQLYANRISALFTYQGQQKQQLFKIMPFLEARRNVKRDIWEREELGLEAGRDIFPWFYLGEAIQAVWLREDYQRSDQQNYNWHKERKSTESETRFMFKRNILSIEQIEFEGFLLGEYTYDFEMGAGVRNETTLGIILPLNKNMETGVNWRRIDRIHILTPMSSRHR